MVNGFDLYAILHDHGGANHAKCLNAKLLKISDLNVRCSLLPFGARANVLKRKSHVSYAHNSGHITHG